MDGGAILSLHSGFPITADATDVSGTTARSARANCIAPAQVYGTSEEAAQGGYIWFNSADFAQPAAHTFGNCGVSTFDGPGLKTLDFNLAKYFSITEHQKIELRGEFINLTNTPILNSPSRSIGTTMGLLQGSQGARNVQIALKYTF